MRVWGGLLAAGAALALSATAVAQTTEQASAKPTARDLAYQFVHDPNTGDLLAEARESVLEKIEQNSSRLSPSTKAWLKTAMTDAAEQATAAMLPTMEERLINAYAEKFTAEELQQVLDFQAFVRQPHIAAAYAKAQKAGKSGADTMLALKDNLAPEDFERIVTTTLKHPMLTVTIVTLQETKSIATEFTQRFNAALSVHCATAPESIQLCKDSGRAL